VLLAGGTKTRQQRDIATAHSRWADYRKRRAHKAGRASPLPFLSQLRRPGVRRKGGRSWRV